MEKIPLYIGNYHKKNHYFYEQSTDKFYGVNNKHFAKSTFRAGNIWFVIGILALLLANRADIYYIPHSSTVSNALLLAVSVLAATINYFRSKWAIRKRYKTLDYQFVLLENKEKAQIFKDAINGFKSSFVMVVVFVFVAILTSIIFLRTSQLIYYFLVNAALIGFISMMCQIKVVAGNMKIIRREYEKYKDYAAIDSEVPSPEEDTPQEKCKLYAEYTPLEYPWENEKSDEGEE